MRTLLLMKSDTTVYCLRPAEDDIKLAKVLVESVLGQPCDYPSIAMVFDVGIDNWSFREFFGIPKDLLPLLQVLH
eukprot:160080-Amphidinium_carterae.1